MDILYRIFYIVISISLVTVSLAPVVIFLRFFMRKMSASGVMWLWGVFFLRSVCPVAMSSIFSIIPMWNRSYHILLSGLGLQMENVSGKMTGWQSVLHGKITVDFQFAVCSFMWLIAVFAIWVCIGLQQWEVRKRLLKAEEIDKRIYQINGLAVPVIIGIVRPKIYISSDMTAKEAKYILRHMNEHIRRKDSLIRFLCFIVVTLQWFNPLIWLCFFLMKKDMEIVSDRQTIRKVGIGENKEYAQEILHMKRGRAKEKMSVYLFQEEFLQSRATEMLYTKKLYPFNEKIASLLILLLLTGWVFMLRPLQILWNGGTWSLTQSTKEDTLSLHGSEPEVILAEMSGVTPEGLGCVVQLGLMNSDVGEDEREEKQVKDVSDDEVSSKYKGEFALILKDMYGTVIATQSLNGSFLSVEPQDYEFPKNMSLYASDYNGDGIQEIVLGQMASLGDGTNVAEYTIWNIETSNIKRIANGILSTDIKDGDVASRILDTPENTTGVLSVNYDGKISYYVWDTGKEEYVKKSLTKEDLKNFEVGDGNGNNDGGEGEQQTHRLEYNGKEIVNVSTQKDGSGNEVVDSITFPELQGNKKVEGITGYYCDLQWVQAADGVNGKYAVLTYNGTKAQTFVVFDVEKGEEYYRQEDGNGVLQSAFEQYDGNSDISFADDDVVVYSLMEKDGEQLKIGFAANLSDSDKVSGSYLYNVQSEIVISLKYSR